MMPQFSTYPGVLIAVPQLNDPNFHHSVVLMIEHDQDGAMGVVINRPIDHRCAEVTGRFNVAWPGHPGDQIRRGGPVSPETLWMVHDDGWSFEDTLKIGPGVAISRSSEALSRMCQGQEQRLVLLVGYAGWGAGQLEQEIVEGSWIVGAVHPEFAFEISPERVWHEALAQLGIDPIHLVESAPTVQ